MFTHAQIYKYAQQTYTNEILKNTTGGDRNNPAVSDRFPLQWTVKTFML